MKISIEGIKPINKSRQSRQIENGIFKIFVKKASEKKISRKTLITIYSNFCRRSFKWGSITLETPTHKRNYIIINSNETAVAIPETKRGLIWGY
jgi:hypothetical protein